MNILLAGAGRRMSFVERLLAAGFNVASYEIEHNTPISKICPVYVGRGGNDTTSELRTIKDVFKYDKILPLMDNVAYDFHKRDVQDMICSPQYTINRCYDKLLFERWMLANFPKYYPRDIFAHHKGRIVKPRFGNGSKGIRKSPPNTHWSDAVYPNCDEISQECIIGTEYSVDVYFTKKSHILGISYYMPKLIIRTRDRVALGEVTDSQILNPDLSMRGYINWQKDAYCQMSHITRLVGNKLKAIGPMCFQFMVEKDTNKPYLFEVNARFGGGSILALEAGYDMIDMMKREYFDNESIYSSDKYKINYNLSMKRVNREVFFDAKALSK